jgi:hypothetical protein
MSKRCFPKCADASGLPKVLFIFLAVFGCLVTRNCFSMEFEVRKSEGLVWIDGRGDIEQGDSKRFRQLYKDNSEIGVVVLVSNGGSVFEALSLGRVFRSHKIDTMLPNGGYCYSACFLAMIGGSKRYFSEDSKLGYHQFSGGLPSSNPVEAQRSSQLIASEIISYFHEMEVDTLAVARGLSVPPEEMYVFSRSELDSMGISSYAKLEKSNADDDSKCPWPKEHKVIDPMNLYPECKNRY